MGKIDDRRRIGQSAEQVRVDDAACVGVPGITHGLERHERLILVNVAKANPVTLGLEVAGHSGEGVGRQQNGGRRVDAELGEELAKGRPAR